MELEFKAGDLVTVDRYNAKGDESKGRILERCNFSGFGKELDGYKIKLLPSGQVITTKAGSIMESKFYNPVPDHERHAKK